MSKTFVTLSINQVDDENNPKTTSNTTIQADSLDELQRLLSLAGMPGTAPEAALVGPVDPVAPEEPVIADVQVEEQEPYKQVSSHQVRKPNQLRNNPRFGDNSLAEDGGVEAPESGLSTTAEIAIADTYWNFAKFADHDEAIARTADAYGINGDIVERLVADFSVYEESIETPADPLAEEEEEVLDEAPMMKSFRDYVREREEQFKPEIVSEDDIRANFLKVAEDASSAKPFRFNMAAMAILPPDIMKARSAEEQIDMLYAVADAPGTDRAHSEQLLRLITKLNAKLGKPVDEAYGSSHRAKWGNFVDTVALLPIPKMMVSLDQLADNEYFGDGLQSGQSGVVCFAIDTGTGKPRLTFASSWGNVSEFRPGTNYMTYHDQTGAERPATVITAFNGAEYMDPKGRERIKRDMAAGGMDPNKKYSVRVFK